MLGSPPHPVQGFSAFQLVPEQELRHAVPLLGSPPHQAFGFGGVLRDAFTSGVHEPERELRPGVSLLDAQPEPAHGFGVILLDVFADGRLEPERELPIVVPYLGTGRPRRHLAPDAPGCAGGVHDPEAVRRPGGSLLGSPPHPAQGFSVVLRDAIAGGVQDPEHELRLDVTLLGGQPEPAHGFGVVLRDAIAVGVHVPKLDLRLGVSLLGADPEIGQALGRGFVTCLRESLERNEEYRRSRGQCDNLDLHSGQSIASRGARRCITGKPEYFEHKDGNPEVCIWVLSTCRTRAGSSAKVRTWAAAHEAHVTTFHSANARVRSARWNAFRTDCLRELNKITGAWPDLHYQTVKGAPVVLPSAPRIAPSQLRLVE